MMAKLPRLCEGGTVVCIASGPSLTRDDVAYVRGKATVIAVNDAVLWASDPPVDAWKDYSAATCWADVVYSNDAIWWQQHYRTMRAWPGVKARTHPHLHKVSRTFTSPKHCAGCQKRLPAKGTCWCEGVITLFNRSERGLSLEPDTICTAHNSGGAAINVAVHLGARRVLLLGYDMGPDARGRRHFYDTSASMITSPYLKFRKLIGTMAEPLIVAGVEVINCSRKTALACFPLQPLREALPERVESAA